MTAWTSKPGNRNLVNPCQICVSNIQEPTRLHKRIDEPQLKKQNQTIKHLGFKKIELVGNTPNGLHVSGYTTRHQDLTSPTPE